MWRHNTTGIQKLIERVLTSAGFIGPPLRMGEVVLSFSADEATAEASLIQNALKARKYSVTFNAAPPVLKQSELVVILETSSYAKPKSITADQLSEIRKLKKPYMMVRILESSYMKDLPPSSFSPEIPLFVWSPQPTPTLPIDLISAILNCLKGANMLLNIVAFKKKRSIVLLNAHTAPYMLRSVARQRAKPLKAATPPSILMKVTLLGDVGYAINILIVLISFTAWGKQNFGVCWIHHAKRRW